MRSIAKVPDWLGEPHGEQDDHPGDRRGPRPTLPRLRAWPAPEPAPAPAPGPHPSLVGRTDGGV